MVFALGFMIAGLIALVIAPAFWHRAVRLSTRRLEMLVPLSTREILAERDLLRAGFAIDQRRSEQKEQVLNERHAGDMNELGRRAAIIFEKDQQLVELGRKHSERGESLAATHQALADVVGQFAAASSALYGQIGLVERKDADLLEARRNVAAWRDDAGKQSAALAALESQIAFQNKKLLQGIDEVAQLRQQLFSLGLERNADLATLKATALRLADREESLKAAEKHEAELLRRRRRQIETSRAIERRLVERLERLRAEEAGIRQDLEAARAHAANLTQEIAGLRRPNAAPAAAEREENAILRQNINEIGAAIIRMAGAAGFTLESAAAQQELRNEAGDKPVARAGAKRPPPRPNRA
jgi:hypothetical protein